MSHLGIEPVASSTTDAADSGARAGRLPWGDRAVLLALCWATLSRLLASLTGLPHATNWLHFPIIAGAFALSLRRVQREAAPIFIGSFILFAVFVFSAWTNGAGMINALLGFVLLAEPFLLLAILINAKRSQASAEALGRWLLGLALIQIPVALTQVPHSLATGKPDLVQGTFAGMGPGHHVLGAMSMTAAIYVLQAFTVRRRWIAWVLAGLLFALVVLSGSKQVILAFLIAYILLRLPRLRGVADGLALAARVALLIAGIYLALRLLDAHDYFHEIPAVLAGVANKLLVFPLLAGHFDSVAQWILGVGPGHGVSRMGGWLLDWYWAWLEPLGATRTTINLEAWSLSEPYARRSSFFAALFSWAGIFGDIGLAGLATYSTLLWLIYRRLCAEDLSRLVILAVVVLGFVFDWLEEPNFMLYAMAVIAQRWMVAGSGSAPRVATLPEPLFGDARRSAG